MGDPGGKIEKKRAKAEIKKAKAAAKAAKAAAREAEARAEARAMEARAGRVSVEGSAVGGLKRLAREGLFQTVVKIVAGLIVGYLLIRFGLR